MSILMIILQVGLVIHLALSIWLFILDSREPHLQPVFIVSHLVKEYMETGEEEILESKTEHIETANRKLQLLALFVPFAPIIFVAVYLTYETIVQEDAVEMLFYANLVSRFYSNPNDYGDIKEAVRIRKRLEEL